MRKEPTSTACTDLQAIDEQAQRVAVPAENHLVYQVFQGASLAFQRPSSTFLSRKVSIDCQ